MAQNNKNKKNTQQGEMTVREAGHKGGETTSEKYGPSFYEEIGRKGGNKVRDLIEKGKQSDKRNK